MVYVVITVCLLVIYISYCVMDDYPIVPYYMQKKIMSNKFEVGDCLALKDNVFREKWDKMPPINTYYIVKDIGDRKYRLEKYSRCSVDKFEVVGMINQEFFELFDFRKIQNPMENKIVTEIREWINE